MTRIVYQSVEKVQAPCEVMHARSMITQANMVALADAMGIPYSTFKSAVKAGRFSVHLETALASFCEFDRGDRSWVDESIDKAKRAKACFPGYPGQDTVENFRLHLSLRGSSPLASFGARQSRFFALDPHMASHEISDCEQSTPAGSEMPFMLAAHFEPFHHRSGIRFGFHKAKLSLEIRCANGARATHRLGHPAGVLVSNAKVTGQGLSHNLHWSIERQGEVHDILDGEYATRESPLVTIADYVDGTRLTSRIEVNIFDRATCPSDPAQPLSGNKAALIEQIFSRQLQEAEDRNGWIVLTEQECVVARFEP